MGSLWPSCLWIHFTNCQKNRNTSTSSTPFTSLPGESFYPPNFTEQWIHIFFNPNIVTWAKTGSLHHPVTWHDCWLRFFCVFFFFFFCFPHCQCCKAACTSWARLWDRLQHQTLCSSWSWPSEGFYSNMACYHGDSTVTKSTVTM